MKNARKGFVTIALFAVAATLLTFSVVGSSRAALTYFSETYGAEVSMLDIGVTLVENGEDVSSRDYTGSGDIWDRTQGVLLGKMLDTEEEDAEQMLKLGQVYPEALSVRNSGKIPEYVRVTIYRYWQTQNEAGTFEKAPELDSGLIDLHLTLGNGWHEDEGARTEERTVLYYDGIVPVGGVTPAFSDTLVIQDEDIEAEVTKNVTTDGDGNTVITTEYTYDGARFVLRADVDAVQTHNARDAMMSAWGTTG